jgi:hypothetical protein
MNDHDLPLNAETASAYLDGQLDAAERATAAADPDIMALVDSFTRLRTELGDVKPVVDSTRTAAMAAALAEFDALHAADDVAPVAAVAAVTSLNSRRMRAYRVLTGVAAAAVVGVIAVAALNSNASDRDTASSASEVSTAPTEGLPNIKIAADAAGAAPADTAAAADSAAGSAEAPAFEATTAALPEIDSADALTEFATTVESRTFATPAPQPDSTSAPADAATNESVSPEPSCLAPDQNVIGAILFQGTFAYAVRESNGALRAIDGSDCRVLIEVEAP